MWKYLHWKTCWNERASSLSLQTNWPSLSQSFIHEKRSVTVKADRLSPGSACRQEQPGDTGCTSWRSGRPAGRSSRGENAPRPAPASATTPAACRRPPCKPCHPYPAEHRQSKLFISDNTNFLWQKRDMQVEKKTQNKTKEKFRFKCSYMLMKKFKSPLSSIFLLLCLYL